MSDQGQDVREKKDDEVESLKKEISALQSQVESLTANWKRAAADYQNLQKRTEKEKEEWASFSGSVLLGRFLPVLDDLERAQDHLKDSGLDTILRSFKNILLEWGLREIAVSVGDAFDPHLQECVEVVGGEAEGKVLEILAKGYIMGERVIRPVKVRVSKVDQQSEIKDRGQE